MKGSPLWSSGQSFWLQIQRSGFDSLRYQIFWEAVDLERSPLSLVSTNEELIERNSSGFGLENRDYGHRGSAALTYATPLYPQKLALSSPTTARGLMPQSLFLLVCLCLTFLDDLRKNLWGECVYELFNLTWRRVQVMQLLITSLNQLPVTLSPFGPNILLSIQFSNVLSLCSSRNVRYRVSYTYKTTSKIIVLYILSIYITGDGIQVLFL
jgi:hypothetical protein